MTLLLVVGGAIGITAQLLNVGVGQAANPFYCDCGYRNEEVIALNYALVVGWSAINWMAVGAISLVGVGVALAGRVVSVSGTWRTVSYAIAVGVVTAAVIRVVGSLVSIQSFDPFQVSDLITAVAAGILVPIWAILLARAPRAMEPAA
jgi:hypothetical protein